QEDTKTRRIRGSASKIAEPKIFVSSCLLFLKIRGKTPAVDDRRRTADGEVRLERPGGRRLVQRRQGGKRGIARAERRREEHDVACIVRLSRDDERPRDRRWARRRRGLVRGAHEDRVHARSRAALRRDARRRVSAPSRGAQEGGASGTARVRR